MGDKGGASAVVAAITVKAKLASLASYPETIQAPPG
jgi:hypothetical protein